jgi:hypothetical protein
MKLCPRMTKQVGNTGQSLSVLEPEKLSAIAQYSPSLRKIPLSEMPAPSGGFAREADRVESGMSERCGMGDRKPKQIRFVTKLTETLMPDSPERNEAESVLF